MSTNKTIHIYWSSMTCLQSSFYPHLFNSLNKLARTDHSFKVIDVSSKSFDDVKESVRKADLIVIDHTIHMSYALTLPDKVPEYCYYVNHPKTPEFYKQVWDFLFGITEIKKAFIYSGDLHAISKQAVERTDGLGDDYLKYLKSVDAIVWGYRAEGIPSMYSLPASYLESWMVDYADSRELALNIKALIPTVIELPLCIAESEMQQTKKLRWNIAVPGAGYKTRKIAIQSISKIGQVTMAPYSKYIGRQDKILYYINRFRLFSDRFMTRIKYPIAHYVQEKIISSSDVTYTCGGPLKYFVRKFYEIPASNSLLLADMPDYAADYGFIDKDNYIQTTPEEAGIQLESILKNSELKAKIKAKGHELIKRLHSADKRAEQLIYALNTLVKRPYREAKFVSGIFTIID